MHTLYARRGITSTISNELKALRRAYSLDAADRKADCRPHASELDIYNSYSWPNQTIILGGLLE
jgi:hypothetical protein